MNSPRLMTSLRRNRLVRRAGFTLPELLVTLGVFSILGIAIAHMTLFISQSQAVTLQRLAVINTMQRLDGELSRVSTRGQVLVVYEEFGSAFTSPSELETDTKHALWQPSVHLGPGEAGNYLVMVALFDESEHLSGTALDAALSDPLPPPIEEIYGIYVDFSSYDDTSTEVQRMPVRRFRETFEFGIATLGESDLTLESHLPDDDENVDHEIIGYVEHDSAEAEPLFRLLSFDTVAVDLPITIRDSDESASVRFQTTIRFTNQ
ncbi:MAG: type II secretion system protein J [Opitutales bacterium]